MPKYTDTRPDAKYYSTFLRKFARLNNSLAGVWNMVWENGNGYEGLLPTDEDIEIVSTSDNDTYGTGSHAQEVIVIGQGSDLVEKAYSIKLNGTTPVKLSAEDAGIVYDIVYRGFCTSKDQDTFTGANDGTITIRSVTSQKVMAVIEANKGQTQIGIYRVPGDKRAELTKYVIQPDANRPFQFDFKIKSVGDNGWRTTGEIDFGESTPLIVEYPKPLYLGPGEILMFAVKPEQAATTCTVQVFLELKDLGNIEE